MILIFRVQLELGKAHEVVGFAPDSFFLTGNHSFTHPEKTARQLDVMIEHQPTWIGPPGAR